MNVMDIPAGMAAASESSPAFVQAVAELGARRPIRTSQAIYNAQGIKLLEGGATVDQTLYERLFSHRLALPLDECIDAGAQVGQVVLRDAARAAAERWPFFARIVATSGKAIFDALAAVALPRPVGLHLTLAREMRPALFEHSVLMALLAAHLVRESGADRVECAQAAAAGLLHDLGMLHIEPNLLDSDERLSGDSLKPVYVHPLTSSMLVDRFAVYPKEVVRAIVEHHERLDGSGYPRGLAGLDVSPLGRVLALAEVVTAMFDGARKLPEHRVSLLLRINPRRYDALHVAAVHRLLAAAPANDEPEGTADAATLIARLLRLTDVLGRWRELRDGVARELDGAAHAALFASVDEQNATLQRMLYDAGVTPGQLEAIATDAGDDGAFRVELWALAEELLWQLHAAVNQLKRRWPSASASPALPAALAAWFDAVAALDESVPPGSPVQARETAPDRSR